MPGNVSDGVGAEYGGQHVLLAGLQHGHAHDDGARVQDLKSQNKGGTGNYISCRKLGYNTIYLHIKINYYKITLSWCTW